MEQEYLFPSKGCIPIAGYNIGAGRKDRVMEVMRRLMTVEALVGLVATVIFLQSLGKAKESAVLSLTREIVFGVGLPVLLPMIWGLYALPCFMPVADTLTFLAVAFILYKVKKELEAAISMSDSDGIEQAHQ